MKRVVHLIILLLTAAIVAIGCSNDQSSSKEEAKFVVSSLPDCGKIIQYLNISSGSGFIGVPEDPYLRDSDPRIAETRTKVIHEIIYEKKGGERYALVLLNDDRPPKIVKNIDIGGEPSKN